MGNISHSDQRIGALVIRAIDEGLRGRTLYKKVRTLTTKRVSERSVATIESRLLAAGRVIAGVCDGKTAQSRIFGMLMAGHGVDDAATTVGMPFNTAAGLSQVFNFAQTLSVRRWKSILEARASRKPKRRLRKGPISRSGPAAPAFTPCFAFERPSTARHGGKVAVWEVVLVGLRAGCKDPVVLQKHIGAVTSDTPALQSVTSTIGDIRWAQRMLAGKFQSFKRDRVAKAMLVDGSSNLDLADLLGVPVNQVALVRSLLRRLAPEKIELDRTAHLQPSQGRRAA